jgi:hypothetical protein
LADATGGGVWTSVPIGVATIGASTGLVAGVSAGTALITYTVGNVAGCTNSVTQTVTVSDVPTITGTTPGSVCRAGNVTLGATASSGTINWYDAGGNLVGTGTSFTTNISTTTTYYVDATDACGTTAVRTAVVATVNALPVVSAPASVAVNGTVTLSPTTWGTCVSNIQSVLMEQHYLQILDQLLVLLLLQILVCGLRLSQWEW